MHNFLVFFVLPDDSFVWGGRINLEDMLKIAWHVAIFDEAHKLKNRSSKTYEASCQLPTKLRYGLTGTAMQVHSFVRSCISCVLCLLFRVVCKAK